MRVHANNAELVHHEFDSWQEFVDHADKVKAGKRSESITGTEYFTGTEDFGQAMRYAHHGLEEYNRAVDTALTKQALGKVKGPRLRWQQEPGTVSVERYLHGAERPCRGVRRGERHRPHVDIRVSVGALASTPAARLRDGAANIMAALETLKDNGYTFTLSILSEAKQQDSTRRVEVQVLDSRRHYSPYLAAFAVGHPSVLRRFVFGWREDNDHTPPLESGYGSTQHPEGTIATEKMASPDDVLRAVGVLD